MLPRGTTASDVLKICAERISRVVSRGEDGVAQNTAVVERGDEMGCHYAFLGRYVLIHRFFVEGEAEMWDG